MLTALEVSAFTFLVSRIKYKGVNIPRYLGMLCGCWEQNMLSVEILPTFEPSKFFI